MDIIATNPYKTLNHLEFTAHPEALRELIHDAICTCPEEISGLENLIRHDRHPYARQDFAQWLSMETPTGMNASFIEEMVMIHVSDPSILTEDLGRTMLKFSARLVTDGLSEIEFSRVISEKGSPEAIFASLLVTTEKKARFIISGNHGEMEEHSRTGAFARMWKKFSRATAPVAA